MMANVMKEPARSHDPDVQLGPNSSPLRHENGAGVVRCDLLIIGCGPAGMAAAVRARRHGLTVIVADEGVMPGGQIYRQASASPLMSADALGTDYAEGSEHIAAFLHCGATYWSQTLVWQIERMPDAKIPADAPANASANPISDRAAHPSLPLQAMITRRGLDAGTAGDTSTASAMLSTQPAAATCRVQAAAILLATGAQERPWPIRGWTLPGVMTVGAAQTLLKAAGLAPASDVVLAGSGPLLWLYASQLLRAGRRIQAIIDTTPAGAYRRAWRQLPGALRATGYLVKGLQMMRAVRRAGVPIHRYAEDVEVIGDLRAQGVRFRSSGHRVTLTSEQVLLHQGVIPATHLSRSAGCVHRWSDAQACWVPETDAWGQSSVPQIWIAGDGAAIGGAALATHRGVLAALDIALSVGRIDGATRDREATAVHAAARSHAAIRPLLDALYTPPLKRRLPPDDVVVCRCEEVSAGDIRHIARQGCMGPNQMKAFSRCGMGPCQGRLCGSTVTELIADTLGKSAAEVGYYRIRAPIKPVTVAEIAAVMPEENEIARGEFPS